MLSPMLCETPPFENKENPKSMFENRKIETNQYPLEFQTVEFCLLLEDFITNPGQVATLGKGEVIRTAIL